MRGAGTVWTRGKILAFMASLAHAAKQPSAREGYLLELLSYCAFKAARETAV